MIIFILIMPQSEKPIPVALFIFDAVIVAVLPLLEPPLLFDAFGSIGPDDLMQFSFVPEQHGWIIRNGCSHLNAFGLRQKLQRSELICAPCCR